MNQYIGHDGTFINETGSNQYILTDGTFVSEQSSVAAAVNSDLTLTYNVAARVSNDLVITYNVLVAGGPVEVDLVIAYNVASQVSSDLAFTYNIAAKVNSDLTLTYNVLSSTASVTSDVFELNTGTPYTTETAYYSWFPNGRTGSLAGITPVEGSKALVGGTLTVTGLAAGVGMLKASVRGASAALDAEFLQHLTAA